MTKRNNGGETETKDMTGKIPKEEEWRAGRKIVMKGKERDRELK